MKAFLSKIKEGLSKVLSTLVDCIVPTLPIMIGVGMLKVILIVLGPQVLNLLAQDSDTFIVFSTL